jgi:hypothetical protein
MALDCIVQYMKIHRLSAETNAVKSTCGELLSAGIMMLTLILGCIIISGTSCIYLTIPVLVIVPVVCCAAK